MGGAFEGVKQANMSKGLEKLHGKEDMHSKGLGTIIAQSFAAVTEYLAPYTCELSYLEMEARCQDCAAEGVRLPLGSLILCQQMASLEIFVSRVKERKSHLLINRNSNFVQQKQHFYGSMEVFELISFGGFCFAFFFPFMEKSSSESHMMWSPNGTMTRLGVKILGICP